MSGKGRRRRGRGASAQVAAVGTRLGRRPARHRPCLSPVGWRCCAELCRSRLDAGCLQGTGPAADHGQAHKLHYNPPAPAVRRAANANHPPQTRVAAVLAVVLATAATGRLSRRCPCLCLPRPTRLVLTLPPLRPNPPPPPALRAALHDVQSTTFVIAGRSGRLLAPAARPPRLPAARGGRTAPPAMSWHEFVHLKDAYLVAKHCICQVDTNGYVPHIWMDVLYGAFSAGALSGRGRGRGGCTVQAGPAALAAARPCAPAPHNIPKLVPIPTPIPRSRPPHFCRAGAPGHCGVRSLHTRGLQARPSRERVSPAGPLHAARLHCRPASLCVPPTELSFCARPAHSPLTPPPHTDRELFIHTDRGRITIYTILPKFMFAAICGQFLFSL